MIGRLPEFTIPRGSTICLECGVDVEDGLLDTDTVYATFRQGNTNVIEYALNGTGHDVTGHLEIDEEDPTLLQIVMTQADTLKLETGEVLVQIRIKRGDLADTMVPVRGLVGQLYKGGEI